jgi:hypothetical protein
MYIMLGSPRVVRVQLYGVVAMASVTLLAAILALISLAPFALYLLGRLDPLDPSLFVGALTFGVCAFKPLAYTRQALALVTAGELRAYLTVCTLSLLAFYAGCLYVRRRLVRRRWHGSPIFAMDANRLVAAAILVGLIGDAAYIVTYHHYRESGYIRDLSYLRLPAAVLAIQAMMMGRRGPGAVSALIMGLFPSVARFITYGGRGVTAEMFMFLAVPILFRGRRPAKALVLALGLIGGLTVHYLAATRTLISEGLASNRLSALILAFEGNHEGLRPVGYGNTFIEGTLELATVRKLGNYDDGRVLWNTAVVFLPHEWFPNKYHYVTEWALSDSRQKMVDATEGVLPPRGTAPTGYTDAFIEFGWLAPIFWFAIGTLCWWTYARARNEANLAFHGYYVALLFGLLYLVAQQIQPALENWLFSVAPLVLVYAQCRLPTLAPLRGGPAGVLQGGGP